MGWIVVTAAGRYRVNWRDPAGRQRAKTLRTKRDAKSFLAQVEADSARGTYVDPHAGQRALLRDFAAEWLDGRTVEVTTDERTRSILRAHVLPRWGDWPLSRIDHTSVQRWVRELSEIRAPATVAKCVNTLSLILASSSRVANSPHGYSHLCRQSIGASSVPLAVAASGGVNALGCLVCRRPCRRRVTRSPGGGRAIRWSNHPGISKDPRRGADDPVARLSAGRIADAFRWA